MTNFSRREAITTATATVITPPIAAAAAKTHAATVADTAARARLHRGFADLTYGQLHYRVRTLTTGELAGVIPGAGSIKLPRI